MGNITQSALPKTYPSVTWQLQFWPQNSTQGPDQPLFTINLYYELYYELAPCSSSSLQLIMPLFVPLAPVTEQHTKMFFVRQLSQSGSA